MDAGVPEPNAMTLATVGENGRPSTRIVLIKEFDADGLVWYTNYLSRKGRDIAANPFAALQFHWVELERVVRIEGAVERIEGEPADEYYRSRPLASRIGAWASEQSQPISSRAVLVARAAEYGLKFGAESAAAAALGRIPAASGLLGILAGPAVAAARPARVPARG